MTAETMQSISDEHRTAFERDGVVKVGRAVDPVWIDRLLGVADAQLASPGRWVTDTNPGAGIDRLFTSRYLWRHEPTIREFIFESGIARLVGEVIGASSLRFYFDHTLVKEPGTGAPTPWHQDIPYWPFLGTQIASAWLALSSSTVEESSLEFVSGSHGWGNYYAPSSFDGTKNWTAEFEGEPMPDIEAARGDYDIVGFDVEPGDVIVFSAWILHGARGNAGANRRAAFSTRWLGDDSRWSPHPGCDPTISQDDVTVRPGAYPADDDRFPLVWSRSPAGQ
jgi:ectoine hydroxylase-related dioxygenase (phytanoyl-CoA dioxygenase family)